MVLLNVAMTWPYKRGSTANYTDGFPCLGGQGSGLESNSCTIIIKRF